MQLPCIPFYTLETISPLLFNSKQLTIKAVLLYGYPLADLEGGGGRGLQPPFQISKMKESKRGLLQNFRPSVTIGFSHKDHFLGAEHKRVFFFNFQSYTRNEDVYI